MHAQENPPELTLQRFLEMPAPEQSEVGNLPALNVEVFSFLQQTLAAEVLSQIYSEFLERTRDRIRELVSLDRVSIREFAHTVAGTAGMLGATALATYAGAAGTMEPRSGELEQFSRMMEVECERVETELRRQRVAL